MPLITKEMQKSITQSKILPFRPPRKSKTRGRRPTDSTLPRYLTQEELSRFRRAVHAGGDLRDMLLFGLAYRFGLRAVEATRLLVEDVDPTRGRIRIHRAKSGHTKEYPLPRDFGRLIRRYLRKRVDRGPYLFTGRQSTNQRGLTVLRIQQLFKRYAKEADLPTSVASHSLRHSIAVHSLEEGFGLEYVADLLGHTSIRSTAIYARISSKAREGMMQQLDRSQHIVSWV